MFNFVKNFFTDYKRPNLMRMKVDERYDAMASLMKAQSNLEYQQSMVAYETARIARLSAEIGEEAETKK